MTAKLQRTLTLGTSLNDEADVQDLFENGCEVAGQPSSRRL